MPLVLEKAVNAHTTIGIWKIEEDEEAFRKGLQLKQHELDFIDSLGTGKRLIQWLATRRLLRQLMNTDEYIDCDMDDHGKPYLLNSHYKISFSHSFDYAAVIISDKNHVGIDIELIKHKIKSIKHKFLSDLELAQPQIGDNTNGLYVAWCAKEAVYKWHGKKGLEFKQHIHIKPFKLKNEGSLKVIAQLPTENKELDVNYFNTKDGYMVAYVSQD